MSERRPPADARNTTELYRIFDEAVGFGDNAYHPHRGVVALARELVPEGYVVVPAVNAGEIGRLNPVAIAAARAAFSQRMKQVITDAMSSPLKRNAATVEHPNAIDEAVLAYVKVIAPLVLHESQRLASGMKIGAAANNIRVESALAELKKLLMLAK